MTKTCDTSKVTIREIPKSTAKRMIKKFHYTHSFSSCRFALGIFYQKDTQHRFFDTEDEELIGCMSYGYPVGRSVVGSIFSDEEMEDLNIIVSPMGLNTNFLENIFLILIEMKFLYIIFQKTLLI